MVTIKHKSRAETQNRKRRQLQKMSQKTTKLKWQRDTQEKRKSGDIQQPENK